MMLLQLKREKIINLFFLQQKSIPNGVLFCLPCMQTIPGLERKSAHLIGGKSNAKSSASLATVGCEGRPSKLVEHREIEPILAYIGGKVAKSADAQNPNGNIC
jgi:hypothetical protein